MPARRGVWRTRPSTECCRARRQLAARLFPAGDALGKTVTTESGPYRVVGVIDPWMPQPRFYDPIGSPFGQEEEFFLPFPVAVDHQINMNSLECHSQVSPGWAGRLEAACAWGAVLGRAARRSGGVRAYRQFLTNYAVDEQKLGRFAWPPLVQLSNVPQWLQALAHRAR